MPSRKAHAWLGAVGSVATYILECNRRGQQPQIEEVLASAIGGGVTGIAPDVVEPATNPNHREFFHSGILGLGLGKGVQEIDGLNLTEKQKAMARALAIGYLSHLAADATTPKGLQMVD